MDDNNVTFGALQREEAQKSLKAILKNGVKLCKHHFVRVEVFPLHYEFCPFCGRELELLREVNNG